MQRFLEVPVTFPSGNRDSTYKIGCSGVTCHSADGHGWGWRPVPLVAEQTDGMAQASRFIALWMVVFLWHCEAKRSDVRFNTILPPANAPAGHSELHREPATVHAGGSYRQVRNMQFDLSRYVS